MITNRRYFQKAVPIWLKDGAGEMNRRVIFQTTVQLEKDTEVHLATSCVYSLYIDSEFIAYGPARAGRNMFRMEELPVGMYARIGASVITIEVQSYQVNSFYIMQQEPFLQAEVTQGQKVLSYTGDEHFCADVDVSLVQKIQRFSFQRPFIEAYRLQEDSYRYRTEGLREKKELVVLSERTIIERITPYPEYEVLETKAALEGRAFRLKSPEYIDTRSYTGICEKLKGFLPEELEWHISREVQDYIFQTYGLEDKDGIAKEEYRIYELPYDAAGTPVCDVTATEDTTLYVLFDEMLLNEDVQITRDECCRAVKYELKTGSYRLKFFEVYCMKYIKLFVAHGNLKVNRVQLITYMHPQVDYPVGQTDTDRYAVMNAAINTFRANAVDLLTDCPSRERGGYLCDSFFSGRTEHLLTGKNLVENSFLQNFLHEKNYQCIAAGMVPMCYPADHLDGVYIPNWGLWLILELAEYLERTGDQALIEEYREKAIGIIEFHRRLEGTEYLMTHIPEGVFVEWSHANEMVQDINFPSNMLYYAALRAASKIYRDPFYADHAEKMKEAVIQYAYNGRFFCDHAKMEKKEIHTVDESSEACQYYAFCFGIADKESFPELFECLLTDFTEKRHIENKYPDICFAELFIGIPLRIEMLLRYERYEDAYREIMAYYLSNAKQTGTLWEVHRISSCNHGFSSVAAYWLEEIKNRKVIQVLKY